MTFAGLLTPLIAQEMKKRKEAYTNVAEPTDGVAVVLVLIFWAIDVLLFIWAIYLSFVRNNGFEIGSFLVACCCSPCYIVYAYAVPVNKLK